MNKFDYIVNPNTGRKVNINTRLGKKILQNYKNINQMGGLGLSLKKKKSEEVVSNEEPIETTEEIPKKKSLGKKIRQGARNKIANIRNKSAEFERKSPKAAMALKMATTGAAKAALGILPGGKLIASGVSTLGKFAGQELYKRSPKAREQWWKHHLSSGNWQRNRDKAILEFETLDHDNSGTINKEEFLLSIPGMYHPDSNEALLLKERIEEKEKRAREGTTSIQTEEEINSQLERERRLLEDAVDKFKITKKGEEGEAVQKAISKFKLHKKSSEEEQEGGAPKKKSKSRRKSSNKKTKKKR